VSIRPLLSLPIAFSFPFAALRGEDTIDFEDIEPTLPGWSALLRNPDGDVQYRPAEKWDTPFTLTLDAKQGRNGTKSLKWEFTEAVTEPASFGPPPIPAKGPNIEIRFFIRTEGVTEEATLSVDESDAGGKRLKGHWEVHKVAPDESWAEVSWEGAVSAETAAVRIRFGYREAPAGAKIWIDDLSVKTVREN
jgi:hypothetical protein